MTYAAIYLTFATRRYDIHLGAPSNGASKESISSCHAFLYGFDRRFFAWPG